MANNMSYWQQTKLQNSGSTVINPATEDKQNAAIAALAPLATAANQAATNAALGLVATKAIQTDGSQKTQIVDSSGNVISSVSNGLSTATKLVDEAGAVYGVKQINNKPRVSAMPYLYDIAEGNVPAHKAWSKIGFAPSFVANANTDIWSYCATQPVYLFPTAAQQMEVLSSNNVADIGTSIKAGTSTGGSTVTLVDAAADFTAATAVAVGDTVILDKSGTTPEYGYVTAVTSATELAIAGGFSAGGTGSGRAYAILDRSATAGAHAVKINYLDGAYAEKSEIVILNGTTAVPTVNTDLFRINSFRVIAAGANNIPTGNITIRHLTDTPVYSFITAGFNRARNIMYTVPAGKNVYVTDFNGGYATTGNANKEYGRITTRANIDVDTKFNTGGIFHPFTDAVSQNSTINTHLPCPTKLPAKTDIKVSAICSATGIVVVTLRGWIEDA